MEKIKILHINDLHSHFEKYPKIKRFFADNYDDSSLAFDLGDNVDRSHPLTEATNGKANIEFLNELNLTAATVGNNEGLSLEHDHLNSLYDQANFPVILSNLKESKKTPSWAQEKLMIESESGMKIAVLGLTYPYPLAYEPFGWDIEDPLLSLERVLADLDADFIILLSHLGIRFDEEIAKNFDIDLIIGAHTHHVLEVGAEKNGTLLAAAGCYGEYIGKIELEFDDSHRLITSDIQAVPTNTLTDQEDDNLESQALIEEGYSLLAEKGQVKLKKKMSNTEPDFEATRFLADIFADYAEVPVAILNSGLIVGNFSKKVTPAELLKILPHSMRLVRFEVTGSELVQILEDITSKAELLQSQSIHGMGFRGKYFGDLVAKGISKEGEDFLYLDKKIKSKKKYKFVVPDQYYFAKYFQTLKEFGQAEILFPKFLREIVYDYLKG